MLTSRAALPIAEMKGDILHLLKDNDVLVICGETGCGKTTQVKTKTCWVQCLVLYKEYFHIYTRP